ncbi:hypothetical protein INR49_012575, partial [Caranx melampygus]
FRSTLPYPANLPITVYTERINVRQVPPSALSLPASSARPLPGRCLCRSPHSTDRHLRCGCGDAIGSFADADWSLGAYDVSDTGRKKWRVAKVSIHSDALQRQSS